MSDQPKWNESFVLPIRLQVLAAHDEVVAEVGRVDLVAGARARGRHRATASSSRALARLARSAERHDVSRLDLGTPPRTLRWEEGVESVRH